MKHRIGVILPSAHSAFFTVVAAVVLMVLFMVPAVLDRTGISSYFVLLEAGETRSEIYSDYQEVRDRVNTSRLAADSATFLVWSVIGLIAYAIVISLKHAYAGMHELVDETRYTRWGRRELWMSAGEKMILRLGAIALLYAWILLLLHMGVPAFIVYVTTVIESGFFHKILYGGISFLGTVFAIHVTIVLLRLSLLRTRVFLGDTMLSGGH